MDFSKLSIDRHNSAQAKFYLSSATIQMLNAMSKQVGLSMSHIVDVLVNEELSRQLPESVVAGIKGARPRRPQRAIQPKPEKDFSLD